MAVFEYKALDKKGKKATGIVDAESLSAAKAKLRKECIYPTSLNKIDSHAAEKSSSTPTFLENLTFFGSVSSSELAMVTRQMSTLLSAGFPLVKAVGTIVPQTRSKTMKKVLSRVKDAVEEGSSFANALALYPNVFSPLFINMVNAGESSGTLEIVLERLADFNENREDTRKKVQAALVYPIFMTIVCTVILMILLTYVVPQIVSIFSDLSQTLPLPTRVLIQLSDFMKTFWWAVLLVPFAISFIFYLIRKSEKGALMTDRIAISLPLAGPLLIRAITARLARTLGSLLDNGVPMLTAINISKSVAGNLVFQRLFEAAHKAVEQGSELSRTLSKHKKFPELAVQMITIGETSGQLEKMLTKTADLYEKEVQASVTAISSLVEPLIILVMGVLVAGIILSICLPIFEISQFIQ